jgi:hypothetical protein
MSLENDHAPSTPSELVGMGQPEYTSPNDGVVVLDCSILGAMPQSMAEEEFLGVDDDPSQVFYGLAQVLGRRKVLGRGR